MISAIPHQEARQSLLPQASRQDGSYPRPQMMRSAWASLDGQWDFTHDDEDAGVAAGWSAGFTPAQQITVPFPPESEASGVGEPGFHPVVWYQRRITTEEAHGAGWSQRAPRLLLHFGAVDYRAQVWVNGQFLGEHSGGHTPFTLTLPVAALREGSALVVLRVEDDPQDQSQLQGKQDWHEQPHGIWYHRTTGIWQSVWLEAVPDLYLEKLMWLTQGPHEISLTIRLGGVPVTSEAFEAASIQVHLWSQDLGEELCTAQTTISSGRQPVQVPLHIPRQRHGQAADELYWTPQNPRLIDATVTLRDATGDIIDAVSSYTGMRTVSLKGGALMLNGRPWHMRSVLNQGFWPESHLAAPSPEALKRDVELIQELGFNAARNHQKIEDPRFLYWADRLGIMVWGEAPACYEFSQRAVAQFTAEWIEALERDLSHPSLVTWVPHNESWGVEHVPDTPGEQAFARAMADLTRALDPSRPVVCNDGWEQQNTDIITVHDYTSDPKKLALTYSHGTRQQLTDGLAPSGHLQFVAGYADSGQPVMLTEFGGISFEPYGKQENSWGYTVAEDAEEWVEHIAAMYNALQDSRLLAGTCWTQLTDTLQETNGLLTAHREPKVGTYRLRQAITEGRQTARESA